MSAAILLVLAVTGQICLYDVCFNFDADSYSDGGSPSWLSCVGELLYRGSSHSGKCSPVGMGGVSGVLHHQSRTAQRNFVKLSSGAAARRHERSPCTTESSKTSSMMTTGAKRDVDICGVERPT